MRGESFGTEYKKIDKKLLSRLFVFLKPYTKWVVLAFLLTVVSAALGPLRPYLTKMAIDDYISVGDLQGLLYLIFGIFALIAFHGFIQFVMTYIMQWVGQKVLLDIRLKLFSHINKLSIKFFDSNPVGRLVTRVTNDVEGLNQLFSQGVVMILADLMLIMWIVGFMFYTNVELSLLTLSILPLLLLATSIFRRKVRVLFRDLRIELSSMNSFISENISGIATLKLFNQEKSQFDKFDSINERTKVLNIKTIFWYAIFFPTVEMLSSIAIALVLWYSGANIINETLTIGTLIAFLQYSEMFFRPVRDLSEKYTTLQSAMASAERIVDLLDNNDTTNISKGSAEFSFDDSIRFENLTFSYDGKKEVLKNVNFEIKKGETVAIVGATGSGKTTIINLICKFYEYKNGKITIDNVDLNEINEESLRQKIALVMQDVFLFSRSIKDNIRLGDNSISDEDVRKAALAIGAEDFILRTPSGYETVVSERGTNLSSGERQLISFARAFVANPELLILDEATSNIDSQTEEVITNALDKLLKDRTSIIIAHRLSTIQRADKIIVLHKGEVKEIGNHEELLANKELYYKLYQLQFNSK